MFAFADDWGRLASIYAETDGKGGLNDVVRTPNFDRIAKQGVLFKNAFVNAPSCTPCRSSLLSGQYFWRTGRGAILQGAVWDESIPVWPLMLKDAGYHIGKTLKVWSPGTPADAPYGGKTYSFQQAGGRFNQFSQHATRMVAAGKSVKEAKDELFDEVRGNFSKLSLRPQSRRAVLLLVRPHQRASQMGERLRQSVVELRAGFPQRQAPAVPAGCAGRSRGYGRLLRRSRSRSIPRSASWSKN